MFVCGEIIEHSELGKLMESSLIQIPSTSEPVVDADEEVSVVGLKKSMSSNRFADLPAIYFTPAMLLSLFSPRPWSG
jgi:hypothetical protein